MVDHLPSGDKIPKQHTRYVTTIYLPISEIMGLGGKTHRMKREINLDVNLDFNIVDIFDGIGNIFNMPRLRDLQQNQMEIIQRINGTSRQIQFLQKEALDTNYEITMLFELMANESTDLHLAVDELNDKVEDLAKSELLETYTQESIDQLDILINALPFLLNNKISPSLMNPTEAEKIFDLALEYAESRGLQLVITNPMELYKLNVSAFTYERSWILDLHIPIVNKDKAFQLKKFINVPFTMDSDGPALQLDIGTEKNVLVGLKPGLEQDYRYFLAHHSDCESFTSLTNLYLCSVRAARGIEGTCLPALLAKSPVEPVCFIETFRDLVWGPTIVGNSHLVMFLNKETEIFMSYPNTSYQHTVIPRGRYITPKTPGLDIFTDDWEYNVPMVSSLGRFEIQPVEISYNLVNTSWTQKEKPLSKSMVSMIRKHVNDVIKKRDVIKKNQEEYQNETSTFDNRIKEVPIRTKVERNEILSSVGVGIAGLCAVILISKFIVKKFKK